MGHPPLTTASGTSISYARTRGVGCGPCSTPIVFQNSDAGTCGCGAGCGLQIRVPAVYSQRVGSAGSAGAKWLGECWGVCQGEPGLLLPGCTWGVWQALTWTIGLGCGCPKEVWEACGVGGGTNAEVKRGVWPAKLPHLLSGVPPCAHCGAVNDEVNDERRWRGVLPARGVPAAAKQCVLVLWLIENKRERKKRLTIHIHESPVVWRVRERLRGPIEWRAHRGHRWRSVW